ncbi:MAG TPA: diacylglycerol kinase family protein [Pyrinomonadaceae bacterium]|nr:diacylglycerol kinase family protein [Pyrinomonadaceae bacterium]
MSDSLLVIINNAAARARLAWPRVREALEKSGVSFREHHTTHAGDAQAQARAALRSGTSIVAAVGGDGTLSEVASGFFEACDALREGELPTAVNASAALAVLPAGTGDDFARGLCGGRRAPLGEWVGRLVRHGREVKESGRGSTRSVDLMYGAADGGARRFVCLNAATLGIGAEVAARVAAQKGATLKLSGEARFALAAVRALAAWRERRVRLRVDEGEWTECRTNLIAVANGAYAGGGMNFSPQASTSDGALDVVTACGISRAGIVRELARIHRGGHVANPRVRIVRGSRVRIEGFDGDSLGIEADGDVRGQTPVEFRIMPSALRVVW